jgi:hypothetical protein
MPDKKITPVFDSKKIKELQNLAKIIGNIGDTTRGIGGGKSKW